MLCSHLECSPTATPAPQVSKLNAIKGSTIGSIVNEMGEYKMTIMKALLVSIHITLSNCDEKTITVCWHLQAGLSCSPRVWACGLSWSGAQLDHLKSPHSS